MNFENDSFKGFSSFDSDDRRGIYRRDPEKERFFDLLNDILLPIEKDFEQFVTENGFPSIVITGTPRSGSTFLYQMIAARLNIGYVSNLMARFYKTPLIGAYLQKHLISSEISELADFNSVHGVTERIFEPHEFGYFWSHYLQFGTECHEPVLESEYSRIDLNALNSILLKISNVFRLPVAYKCMIAPFILERLFRDTSIFVIHIVRNRADTVRSILKVRQDRLGSEKKWWSIRPNGWRDRLHLPPSDQVFWQYDRVVESIRASGVKYPDRYLEISYETLCSNFDKILGLLEEAYYEYANFRLTYFRF